MLAPPIGSAPSLSRAAFTASRSTTLRRSRTYAETKSCVFTLLARIACAYGMRFTSVPRTSLARFSIQPVAEVSAGPPLGGLDLMQPLFGGLFDGVTVI